MNIVSFFSGVGLFDYGLINGGNSILLQCEIKENALKILKATFPDILKHTDIMTLSKERFDEYEINTHECAFVGGAPCQQHSYANPNRSKKSESPLLQQLVKLCRTCRPRFLLVENVYGFISDINGTAWLSPRMDEIGYKGQILCFPAQALGAPHKRYRIFALYCRDKVIPNSVSQRRYVAEYKTHKILSQNIPGIWHDRFVAQPGISSMAYGYGYVPRSVKECLECIGNAVVYDVGLFVGKSLNLLNDYFYESDEGKNLLKLPYKTF